MELMKVASNNELCVQMQYTITDSPCSFARSFPLTRRHSMAGYSIDNQVRRVRCYMSVILQHLYAAKRKPWFAADRAYSAV